MCSLGAPDHESCPLPTSEYHAHHEPPDQLPPPDTLSALLTLSVHPRTPKYHDSVVVRPGLVVGGGLYCHQTCEGAGWVQQRVQESVLCLPDRVDETGRVEYNAVLKQVMANLKTGGTLIKGEEADLLVAQLLAYSAMLRAGVVKEEDRDLVVRELLELSGVRKYLLLPVTKLLVEHFIGKGDKDLVTKSSMP